VRLTLRSHVEAAVEEVGAFVAHGEAGRCKRVAVLRFGEELQGVRFGECRLAAGFADEILVAQYRGRAVAFGFSDAGDF